MNRYYRREPYVVMSKDCKSFLIRKSGMTLEMYKEMYRLPNAKKITGYFEVPLSQPWDVAAYAKKFGIEVKENAKPYLQQEEINLDDLIDS